jgi:hypothetical protein
LLLPISISTRSRSTASGKSGVSALIADGQMVVNCTYGFHRTSLAG